MTTYDKYKDVKETYNSQIKNSINDATEPSIIEIKNFIMWANKLKDEKLKNAAFDLINEIKAKNPGYNADIEKIKQTKLDCISNEKKIAKKIIDDVIESKIKEKKIIDDVIESKINEKKKFDYITETEINNELTRIKDQAKKYINTIIETRHITNYTKSAKIEINNITYCCDDIKDSKEVAINAINAIATKGDINKLNELNKLKNAAIAAIDDIKYNSNVQPEDSELVIQTKEKIMQCKKAYKTSSDELNSVQPKNISADPDLKVRLPSSESNQSKDTLLGTGLPRVLAPYNRAEKDIPTQLNLDIPTQLKAAWRIITINNDGKKIDNSKITLEKLISIKTLLENPECHTVTTEWIIPDENFSVLINTLKINGLIISPEIIKRHQNERSDFKAKNNTFTSASMSKTWKNMPKMPWSRGGRKTRKCRNKRRRTRKSRKTRKSMKGRVRRRTNKR